MTEPIFIGINHICVATHDVDRAVRVWADRYGVGPWRVYTFDPSTMETVVDGQPLAFTMRVGLAQLGPTTRVEIIEPSGDDRNPYSQSLKERGGADHLHHVRLDVGEYDAAIGAIEDLGLRTVLSGRYQALDPAVRSSATYFDTVEDLGFIAEVALLPEGFVMPEPEYVYPPA